MTNNWSNKSWKRDQSVFSLTCWIVLTNLFIKNKKRKCKKCWEMKKGFMLVTVIASHVCEGRPPTCSKTFMLDRLLTLESNPLRPHMYSTESLEECCTILQHDEGREGGGPASADLLLLAKLKSMQFFDNDVTQTWKDSKYWKKHLKFLSFIMFTKILFKLHLNEEDN